MAIYLLMNECGFDADTVGFPSLQGCAGVVLQTTTGLFGWHIFGAVPTRDLAVMAPQFGSMIDNHPNKGTPVKLYCARFRRFRPGNGWREELEAIATGIGYTGKCGGYDIGKDSSLTKDDSAYVEFHRRGDKRRCDLIYKRSKKMDYQSGTLKAGTPISQIKRDSEAMLAHYQKTNTAKQFYKVFTAGEVLSEQLRVKEEERTPMTYTSGVTTNTLSKKGVMHEVSDFSISYFNH